MISRPKSWVSSLLAIMLGLVITNITPLGARAQENQIKPADSQNDKEEKEKQQELEKKTLFLLNEVAGAAWSLKLPENRLFVMASAGDLLWPFDEKRARTLYWDALNSINSITPPPRNSTGESLSKAERTKTVEAYLSVFRLRQKLLRQVAQRDAQLALDMLRATRQVAPRPYGPEFPLPDDHQLEQEIATEVAARDPAQALQLARQSLAKGLTLEVLNLLYQLGQKDAEKASQFAGEIVAKLQTVNVATDFRASIIAVQLLESSRIPEANRPTLSVGPVLRLSDEQKRDLVDVLTNAALSVSANTNVLRQISHVMPEVQQFFPERRVALERKLSALNANLTLQQRNENAFSELIVNGNAEELLRRAAASNDERRMDLYREAALIAAFRGTSDSFRDVVSTEISDKSEQRKILELLDREEISIAASRKQLDRLRNLLPKIQRKDERARAMAELALMLKEQGEDAEAVSLLDEAARLIKTDLKSETNTNALLTLLGAYAVVDPPKAFALAERTIDQANQQISMLMLVDRVIKSGAVKKSEIILEQGGIMPLDFIVFTYGKGVAVLAKADFNRTRALTDRFERNELRVLARLLIVTAILRPNALPTSRLVVM